MGGREPRGEEGGGDGGGAGRTVRESEGFVVFTCIARSCLRLAVRCDDRRARGERARHSRLVARAGRAGTSGRWPDRPGWLQRAEPDTEPDPAHGEAVRVTPLPPPRAR